MRQRLKRWGVYSVCAIMTILVVAFVASFFRASPPLVVDNATTVIVSPLAEDGLPDYRTYRFKKTLERLDGDNQGGYFFWRALGPGIIDDQQWKAICSGVQQDVIPRRDGLIGAQRDYEAAAKGQAGLATKWTGELDPSKHFVLAATLGWSDTPFPQLARVIIQNSQPLDDLVQASKQFSIMAADQNSRRLESTVTTPWNRLQGIRLAMPWLLARAQMRIAKGELESAWEDIASGYRLNKLCHGDTVLGLVSWFYHKELVDHVAISLLHHQDVTYSLINRVEEQLLRGPRTRVRDVAKAERLRMTEAVVDFYRDSGADGQSVSSGFEHLKTHALLSGSLDWNELLTRTGMVWEHIEAACYDRENTTAVQELEKLKGDAEASLSSNTSWAKGYLSLDERTNLVCSELTLQVIDQGSLLIDFANRIRAKSGLARFVVRLERHRVKTSMYPDSQRRSSMVGMPGRSAGLVYRSLPGGYLIYSFGQNRKDDRGSLPPETFRGILRWAAVMEHGQTFAKQLLHRNGELDVKPGELDVSLFNESAGDDMAIRRSDADLKLTELLTGKLRP